MAPRAGRICKRFVNFKPSECGARLALRRRLAPPEYVTVIPNGAPSDRLFGEMQTARLRFF